MILRLAGTLVWSGMLFLSLGLILWISGAGGTPVQVLVMGGGAEFALGVAGLTYLTHGR